MTHSGRTSFGGVGISGAERLERRLRGRSIAGRAERAERRVAMDTRGTTSQAQANPQQSQLSPFLAAQQQAGFEFSTSQGFSTISPIQARSVSRALTLQTRFRRERRSRAASNARPSDFIGGIGEAISGFGAGASEFIVGLGTGAGQTIGGAVGGFAGGALSGVGQGFTESILPPPSGNGIGGQSLLLPALLVGGAILLTQR